MPAHDRSMQLDEEDLEGIAPWPFVRGRVDPCDPPDPFALARALGANIIMAASRSCSMVIANDPPTIFLRPRRDDRATAFALAHELAHLAMVRCGVREHVEIDVDEIARRILIPTPFVRFECLTRGRTIDELPAFCRHAESRVVIARARHVLGSDRAIQNDAA
jgi:Zn-dependent peptidase ImmA (M78 family)